MSDSDSTQPLAEAMADFSMYLQRTHLLNLSRHLNQGNVSYAQFFLLGYLAVEDYLTMPDISKKMGHSTAAAVGLTDRLEKLGYVQRLHAADDRRKVMVQITRKGIALIEDMRTQIASAHAESLADIKASPDDSLKDILKKVTGLPSS